MTELDQSKQLAFVLMSQDTEDYKTVALFLVYQTIKDNKNITRPRLYQKLRAFNVSPETVDSSLVVLSNPALLGAGVVAEYTPREGVTHFNIRPKKEPNLFLKWVNETRERFPSLKALTLAQVSLA